MSEPSKLPLIAITATIEKIDRGIYAGQERFSVNTNYSSAISRCGGIPVILPFLEDEALIKQQLEHVDGVILSGGYDVHPSFYNEDPHQHLGEVRMDRDRYEMAVLRIALERNLPILGICRGMQLMNVVFGGSLYQDLSQRDDPFHQHSQKGPIETGSHKISILPDTLLSGIFDTPELWINSFHHQAVKKLAPKCRISAIGTDLLIEAIEHEEYSFCIGVQWHPEQLAAKTTLMHPLFQALISQAKLSTEIIE